MITKQKQAFRNFCKCIKNKKLKYLIYISIQTLYSEISPPISPPMNALHADPGSNIHQASWWVGEMGKRGNLFCKVANLQVPEEVHLGYTELSN